MEIYRCLILGESSLEQLINENDHQPRDLGKDKGFKKASDYLQHGLRLADHNKERYVSISLSTSEFVFYQTLCVKKLCWQN